MSSTDRTAPERDLDRKRPRHSSAHPAATERKLTLSRLSLSSLPALLLLLFLAACGSGGAPLAGISPKPDGNVVLRYKPADAEVVVQRVGLDARGVGSRSNATDESGNGLLRYSLQPGNYLVRISKPGYVTWESEIDVSEQDVTSGEEKDIPAVELKEDPNYTPPAPGQPGDGGSGDGGSVVAPMDSSLRGNPDFDPSSLDEAQRLWYERLWAAIDNPNKSPDIDRLVKSDDEYEFARLVYQYNRSLLMALRATGDLRLLDEVDRMAQSMRGSLSDSWCTGGSYKLGGFYGNATVTGDDGYLNFRRRLNSAHYCKDTADLEETLMHGHLAVLMHAYEMNRNMPSPAGIDYGERADFWRDYLRNHFEAKWRERSGKDFPEMEFLNLKFCHTQAQFTLYYYYMGATLAQRGDSDSSYYLAHARKLTDQYFDEPHIPGEQAGGFVDVDTPLGPAVVYAFGAPFGTGSPKEEACPTTYARLVVEAALELNMEGFYRWADSDIMERLANGVAHFVMDRSGSNSEPLAKDVTGGRGAGGIEPTDYRDRLRVRQANISSFGTLALWQSDEEITEVTEEIYYEVESDPNRPAAVYIPASRLYVESVR